MQGLCGEASLRDDELPFSREAVGLCYDFADRIGTLYTLDLDNLC